MLRNTSGCAKAAERATDPRGAARSGCCIGQVVRALSSNDADVSETGMT
jgi:hypothetical protein